jgi:hypothetical protein
MQRLILFFLCSLAWAQEVTIPEGTFLITEIGSLERWGNIAIQTDRPEIGSKIYVDQKSVTYLGKRMRIRHKSHRQYTESELAAEWTGSGQKAFSFAEIGAENTVVNGFHIDYYIDYDVLLPEELAMKYRIGEILQISENRFLFIHNPANFIFCNKITEQMGVRKKLKRWFGHGTRGGPWGGTKGMDPEPNTL